MRIPARPLRRRRARRPPALVQNADLLFSGARNYRRGFSQGPEITAESFLRLENSPRPFAFPPEVWYNVNMEDLIQAQSEALPVSQNPAAVYLAARQGDGRRTMLQALNSSAALLQQGATAMTLDWSAVRYAHVVALRTVLLERGLKTNSVNKHLSAVRGVLKETWRLGQMSAEDYHRATDVENVKGEALPTGRMLTADEVSKLKLACANARDRAILAVLTCGGLRRDELVHLDVSDVIDFPGKVGLLVRHGKGNKERFVPLANGALDALRDWLLERGCDDGALFCVVRRGRGPELGKRLGANGVYQMLEALGTRAGIQHFSPHDLRRTAGSNLLDAGVGVEVVADFLGHSSVEITRKHYDRRGLRSVESAARKLDF